MGKKSNRRNDSNQQTQAATTQPTNTGASAKTDTNTGTSCNAETTDVDTNLSAKVNDADTNLEAETNIDTEADVDTEKGLLNITIGLLDDFGDIDQAALQAIAEGTREFLETVMSSRLCYGQASPLYSPESGDYHLGNNTYQEDDVIWIPLLPSPEGATEYSCINADTLSYQPRYLNKNAVSDSLSSVYLKARFVAFGQETPGFTIICHGGEFWCPCQSFTNPYTGEIDHLICIYNASTCLGTHRHYYATIDAEVGNLSFLTDIRYLRGAEIDWCKRFMDEVEVIRRCLPTYNPFMDPYDPGNVQDGPEWQFYNL